MSINPKYDLNIGLSTVETLENTQFPSKYIIIQHLKSKDGDWSFLAETLKKS